MDGPLEKAQDRFINYIASACDDFGLNRFVAQIYGLLYMSDKPLSLDEISEKLKASKGNVSINIRELEKWGAVRNVLVRGSRKDYYEAELDIKKVLMNKIKGSIQKRIGEVSGMINECNGIIQSASEGLTEEEKRLSKLYKDRLKKIEDIKSLASKALSLAEKLF